MYMHVCMPVAENCENLYDSYGEICVRCNCCGRFGEESRKESQRKLYLERLEHEFNFNNWSEDTEMRKHQEKVVEENIAYFNDKLTELGQIEEKGETK